MSKKVSYFAYKAREGCRKIYKCRFPEFILPAHQSGIAR